MRVASLLVAGLVAASTAAAGLAAAATPAPTAKAQCAASLQKLDGAKGYVIARSCAPGAMVGVRPAVDGLGVEEEGGAGELLLAAAGGGLFLAGLYFATDENDVALPTSP